MVRTSSAHVLFDVAATETTPPPPMTDDAFEAAPPTQRLTAFELAYVVAGMNDAPDDEPPAASRDEDAHPSTEDRPTLESIAPPIPASVPSPLGDDDAGLAAEDADEPEVESRNDGVALRDLALDLDEAFAFLVKPADPGVSVAEPHDAASADAERVQRSVVASWVVSAVVVVLVAMLAGRTQGREPRAAEVTAAPVAASR